MKKASTFLLILVLLAAIACGCGTDAPENVADTEEQDQLQPPQRIISLMPSNTEILFALGLGDAVVGVTDYCNYPPEVDEAVAGGRIQRIGDSYAVNEELVVSLDPDLVILGYDTEPARALKERLSDMGIAVETVFPASIAEVLQSINRLGELTGRETEAALLVEEMEAAFDRITATASLLTEEEKPKVLILLDLDSLYAIGRGTLEDELITAAGGINVLDAPQYAQISEEAIIDSAADIIICTFPFRERILAEKEAWRVLPAVQNEAVYDLDGDLINRPGPRLAEGLELIYSVLHPEP